MMHTITLHPGDTITIQVPSIMPSKIEKVQLMMHNDELKEYPIFELVCNALDITIEDLVSKNRKSEYVIARFIIAHHLFEKKRVQKTSIGRLMNRCHSDVLHYIKKYIEFTKNNDEKLLNALKQIQYYENCKD